MKPFNSKRLSIRKTVKATIPTISAFINIPIPEQYNSKCSDIPPTQKSCTSDKVVINGVDGCICVKCKEFFPYAEPNREDGTMICFSCRTQWG